MLYRILHFIMTQSLHVHYRRIIIAGNIELKQNESYLIAASHPNSFLDAIVIATVLKQPLYFLARSDVFNKKWSDFLLRKMNLIPIYRLQEGHENLTKNDVTFSSCFKILEQKGSILIFAEGISLIDKKIRPLKKGLARIGFGAEEKNHFKLNTQVIPIGINYQKAKKFDNNILVSIQAKIPLKSYEKQYQINSNQSYIKLNEDLLPAIKKASIETDEESIFDFLALRINPSDYTLKTLQRLADRIEQFKKDDSKKWIELKVVIDQLAHLEKEHNIERKEGPLSFGHFFSYIALSPFAILGYLINITPFALAKLITEYQVKLDEFYDSVRLVLGTVLWILWATLLTFILFQYVHPILIASPILLFLIGKVYLFHKWITKKIKYNWAIKRLKQSTTYKEYVLAEQKLNELILNIT